MMNKYLVSFVIILLVAQVNSRDLQSRSVAAENRRTTLPPVSLTTCGPIPTNCPCGIVLPANSLCYRCKRNCPTTTTRRPTTTKSITTTQRPSTVPPTTTRAPTTKIPTSAPTTKSPTSASTTLLPATTKAPTAPPTTVAPTTPPGPTTKAPTAPPTTVAPTTNLPKVWSPRYGDAIPPINCPMPTSWTQDVTSLPVHPQSATWKSKATRTTIHPDFGGNWDGGPFGIPYTLVSNLPLVNVDFSGGYTSESDYNGGTRPIARYPFPITNPPLAIEGAPQGDAGDQHVLVLDVNSCKLFETWITSQTGNTFKANNGAVFSLNNFQDRPIGWTSGDAAGLPILPGLVTYDDVVVKGVINHAIRFTVSVSQQGFIYPARHFAGSQHNNNYPPMGARLRLRASFDCNTFVSTEARVICTAMKKYGLINADNGSDWYISGAPHPSWNDDHLGELKSLNVINNFDYVDTGAPICTSTDCSTVSPVYPTGGAEWV